MYKAVFILYIVCFGFYVLFSRQPDYFDGEFAIATVHFVKNSSNKTVPEIFFNVDNKKNSADAGYIFRSLKEGEKVDIIYDTSKPSNAAVYSVWGYWLTWGELLASVVLLLALFQIAVAVNKNPSPESLIEQLEYKPKKKKKYQD